MEKLDLLCLRPWGRKRAPLLLPEGIESVEEACCRNVPVLLESAPLTEDQENSFAVVAEGH